MTFGQPLWFWAFALFPVLIVIFFQNERLRAQMIRKLIAARLHDRLAGTVSISRRRARFLLTLAGLACVIVALAQPRLGYTWEQSHRKGRDVIIAIDTSKSMLATDLAPNRLMRAKLAAQDLISALGGDRVGLIAFAGNAFLQAPLTVDYSAVLGSLNELDTEIIPQGGTNIAAAIKAAREAFGKGEGEHRALIIFTDGEDLEEEGEKAAGEIKDFAKIFTVGLGSPEGSLIPLPYSGGSEFVKDSSGQIVKSRLDEGRLRKIAEATGGFYVRLQNGRADVERIIGEGLGKMSEQDIDAKLSRQPIERYQWPLGLGVVLLAATTLIGERRRSQRAALSMTAAALALCLPCVADAKNSGVEAYEREDFKGALGQFSEQLKRQPESPALHYDLGSAAYKSGDLDTALHAFSKAVTADDPELRARAEYNLGNTLYQRGASLQDKEPKLQEWKNALQHYEQAMKTAPQRKDAEYNRDVVRKLIEQLEKEPPKQDQKKDQKKDKKDDQKKDQDKDKQDQQQQGDQQKDSKDQQQRDGDKKDGEKSEPKDGKDGQQKQGDKREQQGQQPEPQPQQEAKKREGDLKNSPQFEKGEKSEAEQQAADDLAAAEGKMTEQQAKALLESLRNEDQRVQLMEPDQRKARTRVFKDW